MRRFALAAAVAATSACTPAGSCDGVNDGHVTIELALDVQSGATLRSENRPWRAVDFRSGLDSDVAARPIDMPVRGSEGQPYDLRTARQRWDAVSVGGELDDLDRAVFAAIDDLPPGNERAQAVRDLGLHDAHGDLWVTRPRSTYAVRDGRVIWRREVLAGTVVTSSGPVVVLQQESRLLGVRQSDGQPLWRRPTPGAWSTLAVETTPAGAQALLVGEAASTGRANGQGDLGVVHAVDVATGRDKWTTAVLGRPNALDANGADVVVGTVVGGGGANNAYTGRVVQLDLITGQQRWAVDFDEAPVASARLKHGEARVLLSDPAIGCD